MSKKQSKQSFIDKLFGRGPKNDEDLYDEEFDFSDDFDGEYEDEYSMDDEEEKTKKPTLEKEDLSINLVDKDTELVAQTTVPGLTSDDIEIDISRDSLTIETTSNQHYYEKDGTYLYEEVVFGSFFRSIPLPTEIDVDESTAEIKEGLLIVRMPKIDRNARKKLSVNKK